MLLALEARRLCSWLWIWPCFSCCSVSCWLLSQPGSRRVAEASEACASSLASLRMRFTAEDFLLYEESVAIF